MERWLKNPWVWGGVAALTIGWYLYSSSSGSQSATDTSGDYATGSIALQPPITSDSVGGVGIPDTSSSSLDALTKAITALNSSGTPESVQLAQINADQLAAQAKEGTTVFQTLIKSLNAHKGLGRITASIPGLGGDVSTWYGKPTITKTRTIIKRVPIKTTGRPA